MAKVAGFGHAGTFGSKGSDQQIPGINASGFGKRLEAGSAMFYTKGRGGWPRSADNAAWAAGALEGLGGPAQCDNSGWTQWQQGFTPKEHREILDRQWVIEFQAEREDRERTYRADREDADLEFREKSEAEIRDFREHQERQADNRHSDALKQARMQHNKEMWIVGGAVTIAIAIITLFAAVVERGHVWPLFSWEQTTQSVPNTADSPPQSSSE